MCGVSLSDFPNNKKLKDFNFGKYKFIYQIVTALSRNQIIK